MTIHHHPNGETLMGYAAGTVDEGMRFVIATHLSLCAECASKVEDMENVGAAVLEDEVPLALRAGALDTIMNMLDDDLEENENLAERKLSSSIPMPLRKFVPNDLSDIPWKNMAPGIKLISWLT
jgi:putative transcriptional regulator